MRPIPLLLAALLGATPTVAFDELVNHASRWVDREVRVCGRPSPAYDSILLGETGSFPWGIYIDPSLTKHRAPGERVCVRAVYLRADGLSQATARERGIGIPCASHGPLPFVLRPPRYAKVDETRRAFSMLLTPRASWKPRPYEPGERPYP